jgi:CspA family cold shock protein
MTTGTVKFFNTARGFGFIEPEDGSKDAFVHISAVERAGLTSLSEGQKVSYELQQGSPANGSATKPGGPEELARPIRGRSFDKCKYNEQSNKSRNTPRRRRLAHHLSGGKRLRSVIKVPARDASNRSKQ